MVDIKIEIKELTPIQRKDSSLIMQQKIILNGAEKLKERLEYELKSSKSKYDGTLMIKFNRRGKSKFLYKDFKNTWEQSKFRKELESLFTLIY